MKKYIMSEKEYNALDSYMMEHYFYDNGFYICQTEEHGDFGVVQEDEKCVSLKELIFEVLVDPGAYEDDDKDAMIILELYDRLEDCDENELPTFEDAMKVLGFDEDEFYYED